jgi:hypothetical protein
MLARLSMDHFHTQILENNPRNQLHPQDVPIFDVALASCQTTTPSQWWKHYQSTWNTGDLGPTLNCMLLHLLSPYICMENASVEYTGFLSLSLSRVGTWKKWLLEKKYPLPSEKNKTLGKKIRICTWNLLQLKSLICTIRAGFGHLNMHYAWYLERFGLEFLSFMCGWNLLFAQHLQGVGI